VGVGRGGGGGGEGGGGFLCQLSVKNLSICQLSVSPSRPSVTNSQQFRSFEFLNFCGKNCYYFRLFSLRFFCSERNE